MLPRRFALIRHVDYTGGAGAGVIAYGVAFDDGQVVLRWSSAHRATSVLDSVEDLIAAHGHGETTSIEWIDAPPGTSDTPATTGRRARRSTSPADEQQATDGPQVTKPADAQPVPQARESEGPAHARSAARAPQAPATADTTPAQPAARVQPATPAPQPAAPEVPAAAAQPKPEPPATPAHPATPAQPAIPAVTQPASPAPEQPAANPPTWDSGQSAGDSSTQPNVAASLGVSRLPQQAPSGNEPAPETSTPAAPKLAAHASPASNGAAHATQPAQTPFSRTAPSTPGDERRARHAAIATQPMKADLSDEPEPRRAQRAAPPAHESPRSIFEEAEEPPRPDLRLASSNGRAHEPDDADDSGSESAQREAFAGFFATGHQHLETVTGLLDLPAGLDKRGRAAETEQDAIASRRNGRHRGE